MDKDIWIVLISQIPLAIYTIWNGIKRNKPEIKKLRADEEAALSDAMEGASQALEKVWKRLDELEKWKAEAIGKINELEDDLRRWRNYAARLIKRLKEVDPTGEIPPIDTDPKVKRVR